MKWVNSAGGPLLFLCEDLLSDWQGVMDGQAKQSDYERACLLDDAIGSINVGNNFGLILNDEPLPTTWVPSKLNRGGLCIRWKYAINEQSFLQHLAKMSEDIYYPEVIIYTVTRTRCLLIDSALPGRDFRKGEFLEVVLALGDYTIQTGKFEPDSETSLIIHKFVIRE